MDDVRIECTGGVLELHLTRPAKKNALTAAMYAALADGFAWAERDEAIRAVLLCGGTGAFTAGNDLADFAAGPSLGPDAPVLRFLEALATCEKPVIAAVAGIAAGIGTTLLLHCDVVVAHAGATFATPFVDLGLVPEAGSTLLLPALLGRVRAVKLLLLNEPLAAAEALDLGLITQVVADLDAVLPRARALAARLAAKPPAALRATKRLMLEANGALAAQMAREAHAFAERLAAPETQAALARFLHHDAPPAGG